MCCGVMLLLLIIYIYMHSPTKPLLFLGPFSWFDYKTSIYYIPRHFRYILRGYLVMVTHALLLLSPEFFFFLFCAGVKKVVDVVSVASMSDIVIIIIIMVIYMCYFSREHIAISYDKWCEHRIKKNQQIKSTALDGKSYLK